MKTKISSLVLAVIMLIGIVGVMPTTATESQTINIGDYILFGTYYGEPILWRCVDIENGKPLILSDRIITIKPFDAEHLNDSTHSRRTFGSNLWETSNMRSWLNSTAHAGDVIWLCGVPPTEDVVFNGWNAYAHESGFLSDDNFTLSERSAISQVSQLSLLHNVDRELATTGTVPHSEIEVIANVVANFDNAFAHYVTDRMFLLDVRQVNRIWQNRAILGENYHMARSTQTAVDNSNSLWGPNEAVSRFQYWLRSPLGGRQESPNLLSGVTRVVDWAGMITSGNPRSGFTGVRPAFFLNTYSMIIVSGDGTYENPFVVDGNGNSNWSADEGTETTVMLEGESYVFNVNIAIPTTSRLIISTFNYEGRLVEARTAPITPSTTNIMLTMCANRGAESARVMIWDGFENMRPIGEPEEIAFHRCINCDAVNAWHFCGVHCCRLSSRHHHMCSECSAVEYCEDTTGDGYCDICGEEIVVELTIAPFVLPGVMRPGQDPNITGEVPLQAIHGILPSDIVRITFTGYVDTSPQGGPTRRVTVTEMVIESVYGSSARYVILTSLEDLFIQARFAIPSGGGGHAPPISPVPPPLIDIPTEQLVD